MRHAPRRRRASQGGFTLIELMISLVLFSFAVAGVLSVAVAMTKAFREQRRVISTENAARAPLDFLSDLVRGASPGVATGNITDTETCTPGALSVLDSATGLNTPDELELVFASGGVVTSTYELFANLQTDLLVADGRDLAVGDYVVITNPAAFAAQGVLVRITGKVGDTPATLTLAGIDCPIAFPGPGYTAGALVIRAQRARFSIADFDGITTLMMDPDGLAGPRPPEPLAEGVEDLQVSLGIAPIAGGVVTEIGLVANDDDWAGNVVGETIPLMPLPLPPPAQLRALRITLIAREASQITGGDPIFFRPAAGNRAASPTLDNYRRRVLTSTVEIRNLSGSP